MSESRSTRTFPQAPSPYAGSASRMSSATSNADYAYGGAAPPPQMHNPSSSSQIPAHPAPPSHFHIDPQRSFTSPATGYPYPISSDPSRIMPVPYQTVPASNPTYLPSHFGAPERERSISGGSNYPNAYTGPDNPIDSDDENLGEGFAAASTSSDYTPKGELEWPFSWKKSTGPKKRGQSTQLERCQLSGCEEYAPHGDMEWVGFCSNSHKAKADRARAQAALALPQAQAAYLQPQPQTAYIQPQAQAAYAQPRPPAAYVQAQAAYGHPQAQAAYGHPQAPQAAYGQPQAQASYGNLQPPQAAYGQPQTQAAYGQSQPQVAYGQPPAQAPGWR